MQIYNFLTIKKKYSFFFNKNLLVPVNKVQIYTNL